MSGFEKQGFLGHARSSVMLVLSRKGNELIFIDDQICIKVLSIRGKSVRLGIEAPNEITVVRGEVAAKLADESMPRAEAELDRKQVSLAK